ncbi:MAG: hypothetical protein RR012_06635 [Oscillospiraceae bacterium]
MNQFKEYCKKYFSFLIEQGYKIEDEDDGNLLSYRKGFCKIQILFDSIAYELTCQFIWDDERSFTLQDVLTFSNIKKFNGLYQINDNSQLQKGIIYLTYAIEEVLKSINVANEIEFDKLYNYRLDMRDKLLKQYYIDVDMKKAQQYWDEKRYEDAMILYEKHIDSLTRVQMGKLKYIKNNTGNNFK